MFQVDGLKFDFQRLGLEFAFGVFAVGDTASGCYFVEGSLVLWVRDYNSTPPKGIPPGFKELIRTI